MKQGKKLSDIDEAFARIHVLEFMLQNVMANMLGELTPNESEAVRSGLLHTMRNPAGTGTAQQFAQAERVAQFAEEFLAKVSRAESVVRGQEIQRREPPRQQ